MISAKVIGEVDKLHFEEKDTEEGSYGGNWVCGSHRSPVLHHSRGDQLSSRNLRHLSRLQSHWNEFLTGCLPHTSQEWLLLKLGSWPGVLLVFSSLSHPLLLTVHLEVAASRPAQGWQELLALPGNCELSGQRLRWKNLSPTKGGGDPRTREKVLSTSEGAVAQFTCLFIECQRKTTQLSLINGPQMK